MRAIVVAMTRGGEGRGKRKIKKEKEKENRKRKKQKAKKLQKIVKDKNALWPNPSLEQREHYKPLFEIMSALGSY